MELGARENVGMGTGETRENCGFGARELFGAKAKMVFGAHEKIGSAIKYLRETFGRRARAKYLVFVFGGRGHWYSVSGGCENAGAGAGVPREN